MSVYPDSIDKSIWRYRDKCFNTKLERDMYQRGFEDGLKECQKRMREFHIREDIDYIFNNDYDNNDYNKLDRQIRKVITRVV